jgi:hypothetical protein
MSDLVTVIKITHPVALESEEMVALFDRNFSYPGITINTKELIEYLQGHFAQDKPGIHLWVSFGEERGLCGMGIVTTWTNPLSPFPFLAHFAAEIREARKPIQEAMHTFLLGEGFTNMGGYNASHLSDRALYGVLSTFGTGEVLGSLILWQLED